jgi:Fic family protein
MKKYNKDDVVEFLKESNEIECVTSRLALRDSLKAWDYAIENYKLSVPEYVFKIHKHLMKTMNPDIAGSLRDCDVYIGRKRKVFISHCLLYEEVQAWLKMSSYYFTNSAKTGKPVSENKIKDLHVMFEYIHPFEDGNGRTGRILYNVQRCRAGLPIHIIHAGDEQIEYYKWFKDK